MLFLRSILSLVFVHLTRCSSECQANAKLWTYYPCSFAITAISFYSQEICINASIDRCINEDVTFFWHFPIGNMTINLRSDENRLFSVRIPQLSLAADKRIKHIYHRFSNSRSSDEQLLSGDGSETLVLHTSEDIDRQCSLKFEAENLNTFHYGTFIKLTVLEYMNERL